MRRAEIGFGGFEAWTDQVYAEEQRAAERLDARLKIEEHWLQRGVTGRRRRNMGRLAHLKDMRAQRAAMIGPQGTAALQMAADDAKTKVVIDAEHVSKSYPVARPSVSTSLDTNGVGASDHSPPPFASSEVEKPARRIIIKDFTFRVTRGDRIGIVGRNGAGKRRRC